MYVFDLLFLALYDSLILWNAMKFHATDSMFFHDFLQLLEAVGLLGTTSHGLLIELKL
jgi:hypothetical protein